MAPIRAPTSGRLSRIATKERVATRSSRPVAEPWGAVAVVAMSGHRVPRLAYSKTCATLLWSTKDGPVSTMSPPPRTLPLVL